MLLLLFCADIMISRVDEASLPDQVRMELFVESLTTMDGRLEVRTNEGEFNDVCKWHNVSCDESDNVKMIRWGYKNIGGPVRLEWLPPHLERFDASKRDTERTKFRSPSDYQRFMAKREADKAYLLSGTLETSALPRGLEHFIITCNNFDGSVDMKALPDSLKDFLISKNAFVGSVNLEKLPSTLITLYANGNQFSGTICLSKLPASMGALNLEKNQLCGALRFVNLPDGYIYLGENDFDEIAQSEIPANVSV